MYLVIVTLCQCVDGCHIQDKMMSCGVSLERLEMTEPDMLIAATDLKDISCEVSEPPSTGEEVCDEKALDVTAECNNVEGEETTVKDDMRKSHKKPSVHKTRHGVPSSTDSTLSTANLRLTLKKVKVENAEKEDDTCLYVCQSKKTNTVKKVSAKRVDRNRDATHKISSATTKASDGPVTHSGKVITGH